MNERLQRQVHPLKHPTENLRRILRTIANMILHRGKTQEVINIIYHNNITIPTIIVEAISETSHDQIVAFRNTIHEAQVDSETIPAIALIAHAHQLVFAREIDLHGGLTSILALIHHYAIYHVLDVAVHSIHLQTANVLRHWSKSR